jgi:hypothetical protein
MRTYARDYKQKGAFVVMYTPRSHQRGKAPKTPWTEGHGGSPGGSPSMVGSRGPSPSDGDVYPPLKKEDPKFLLGFFRFPPFWHEFCSGCL